jgi:hypothetical protein
MLRYYGQSMVTRPPNRADLMSADLISATWPTNDARAVDAGCPTSNVQGNVAISDFPEPPPLKRPLLSR